MKVDGKYLYKATIVAMYKGQLVHKPCLLLAEDYEQAVSKLASFCVEEKEHTSLDWRWMAVRAVNVPMLELKPETFGAYKGARMHGYTPISNKMCPSCNQYELTLTDYRHGQIDGESWSTYRCNKCLARVTVDVRLDEEE
jgi:hypothetical protein